MQSIQLGITTNNHPKRNWRIPLSLKSPSVGYKLTLLPLMLYQNRSILIKWLQRKKKQLWYFAYQRALKDLIALWYMQRSRKKSNLKKIIHTTFIYSSEMTNYLPSSIYSEFSSGSSKYFIDLSNWSFPFYRC